MTNPYPLINLMHRYVRYKVAKARLKQWVIDQLGPEGGKVNPYEDEYLPYKSRKGYYIYVTNVYMNEIRVEYHRNRYGYNHSSVVKGYDYIKLSTNISTISRGDKFAIDYMNPCETDVLIIPTFKMAWKGDITWRHYLFG